ncbi:MAG: peptidoglycan DD-metalloendopeptidase family protein [Oceanospirillaceae bacterium]|nr:peptidoglycan DD-metalloendopeptidase family protein [Oceanospirillaceae bacterium]
MGKYAPATMLHALCYGVFGLLLMACGASQYAPVQELGYSLTTQPVSASSVRSAPASYQVRSGDTLFAIAWRFGWDYKELAKVNAIASPYTIYVGQKLLFSEINKNINKKNNKISSSLSKPKVTTKSVVKKIPNIKINSLNNKQKMATGSVIWQWPLKGSVVQKFANKGVISHGIEISSRLGNSIKAASSGLIVYAGSGIQGYGNLVVVKHNETFLSAYAYNSRILVAEGAQVNAGQVIAEVGKGPQLDPRLHFEIRKDGKPVNPLQYLPKL